jgi:hypothetical protein
MSTPDPIYAAIKARKAALAAWKAAGAAGVEDDERNEQFCDRDADAICAMLSTPPTTLDGLRALVRYAMECEQGGDEILDVIMEGTSEPEVDWDNGRPLTGGAALLGTIATALDQLARQ